MANYENGINGEIGIIGTDKTLKDLSNQRVLLFSGRSNSNIVLSDVITNYKLIKICFIGNGENRLANSIDIDIDIFKSFYVTLNITEFHSSNTLYFRISNIYLHDNNIDILLTKFIVQSKTDINFDDGNHLFITKVYGYK